MTRSIVKRIGDFVRRITPRHWAWIHFKLALGLGWGTAVLFVTAPSIRETISEQSIQLWSIGTVIGGLISIVGIVVTVSRNEMWQIRGLGAETIGLVLLAGGPFQYLLIQVAYLVNGQFDQRYQLAWFAYSMLAAIIVRMVIIIPQFVNVVAAIKREKEVIDNANAVADDSSSD